MQSTVVKPLSICFLIFICIVHYMDGKPIEEEDYDEDTAVSGKSIGTFFMNSILQYYQVPDLKQG